MSLYFCQVLRLIPVKRKLTGGGVFHYDRRTLAFIIVYPKTCLIYVIYNPAQYLPCKQYKIVISVQKFWVNPNYGKGILNDQLLAQLAGLHLGGVGAIAPTLV